MKYEKEATELLELSVREPWMDDEHYQVLLEVFKEKGFTKEKISQDLEEGVKNGYPIEFQVEMVKALIRRSREENKE